MQGPESVSHSMPEDRIGPTYDNNELYTPGAHSFDPLERASSMAGDAILAGEISRQLEEPSAAEISRQNENAKILNDAAVIDNPELFPPDAEKFGLTAHEWQSIDDLKQTGDLEAMHERNQQAIIAKRNWASRVNALAESESGKNPGYTYMQWQQIKAARDASREGEATQGDDLAAVVPIRPDSGTSSRLDELDGSRLPEGKSLAPHVQAALNKYPDITPDNMSLAELDRRTEAESDLNAKRDLRIVRSSRYRSEADAKVQAVRQRIENNGSVILTDEFMRTVNSYESTEQVVGDIMGARKLLEELKTKELAHTLTSSGAEADPAATSAEIERVSAHLRSIERVYAMRQQIENAQAQSQQLAKHFALSSKVDETDGSAKSETSAYGRGKKRLSVANDMAHPDLGPDSTTEKRLQGRQKQLEQQQAHLEERASRGDPVAPAGLRGVEADLRRTKAELKRREAARKPLEERYKSRGVLYLRPSPNSAAPKQRKNQRSRRKTAAKWAKKRAA